MNRNTLIWLVVIGVAVWFYMSHVRKPAAAAHSGAS